jgi:formylmethanofuran:tetrahydromethanopterin formyltransferase
LVEIEEDAGASVSPKVAMAEATEDGRSGQATAVAIQIASELERERGERVRAGLGRLTDPDPSRLA